MAEPLRVLMVEDSDDDAELLLRELRRSAYQVSHIRVADARSFERALEEQPWDLVLCDHTMAGFSGTQALSILRSRGLDLPFIFVSGTIGEETAVAAMRAGAQDYVMKHNLHRLVPAIERELREVAVRREKARADAARQSTEARFQEVLVMAPDAVVAVDVDQRIILFNRAAEALFGYSAEEARGQFLDLLIPSELAAAHRRHLQAYARTRSGARAMNERGAVFGRRKDGETFPAEASISKLVEDGHLTFMAIVRDITERQQLERQLSQSQKMEAVGQLTGGLAHDFNNLLTVITGNLDLLSEELKGRQAEALARVALDASLRGAQLTRQLLAFSRRQSLEAKVFDLNALASGTIDLLRHTIGGQIEVVADLADDLRLVFADPTQVESALVNLAINARDAMPEGGRLVIETANQHLDADYAAENIDVTPGDYVMLAVSDSGTGIESATLDKVFEPFFTTKDQGKGSGLGLSMIYGFAKQSGGHVRIYSEPGHGTTVRLYLPQAGPQAKAPASARPQAAEGPAPAARVLVVEDDAAVRRLAVNMLDSLGYQVLEADGGKAAMALIEAEDDIDLLFTDMVMAGGMSGLELAREARRRRPNLKLLFTTGYTEAALGNDDGGGPERLGAMLSKPYRKHDLAQKIREALLSG